MCGDCVGGQASVCPTVSDHLTHFHTPPLHFCPTQNFTLPNAGLSHTTLPRFHCSLQGKRLKATKLMIVARSVCVWISATHLNSTLEQRNRRAHFIFYTICWLILTVCFSLKHKTDEPSKTFHNAIPHWGKWETLVCCVLH